MTTSNVILPSNYKDFEFDKLTLESPISIPGNAFFTKLLYKGCPIFIQTTTSKTKQGIVKTGKKYHSDLVFDNTAESIILWFENLENKCKQILFEKNSIWFQTPLTQDDIDDTFVSIIKVYKSGKLYSIRTNVKTISEQETSNNVVQPVLKIYNESYTPVSMDDITNETNIHSLLEIKGIKFSSKNFQIEMELKQIMILEEDKIIEDFIIQKPTTSLEPISKIVLSSLGNKKTSLSTSSESTLPLPPSTSTSNTSFLKEEQDLNLKQDLEQDLKQDLKQNLEQELNFEQDKELNLEEKQEQEEYNINDVADIFDNDIFQEEGGENIVEKEENEEDEEINLEHSNEEIELKPKNDFYYELYNQAKKRAKEAKKKSILAYLEAKEIKNTYMLDIENEDSDFDEE